MTNRPTGSGFLTEAKIGVSVDAFGSAAAAQTAAIAAAATDATTKANAAVVAAQTASAQKTANLSDVTSVPTARSNLGVQLGQPTLGPRFCWLGDSITAGSFTAQNGQLGGFVVQTMLLSNGKTVTVRNAGVTGNKAADMLARFDTAVTPYAASFDVVALLAGTNDSGITALATWVTTMKAIVAKIYGIGKQPLMMTIPPNSTGSPAGRAAAITAQNAWIRRYAAQNHIPMVDFYKILVDPTTGQYRAGYSSDGTHPAPAAQTLMANLFNSVIGPLQTGPAIVTPWDSADPNNLLTNGCFTTWSTPRTPPVITVADGGTGGASSAATYYYKVGLLDYQGEALPSNEVSVTLAAGHNATLTIPTTGGNRAYRIYRGTASGAEVLLDTVNATNPTTYTDNFSKTPGTRTPPVVDTTSFPTGWGSGNAGPYQISKLTDSAINGFAARFTGDPNAVSGNQSMTVSTGFSVGDTVALTGMVRTSGVDSPHLKFTFNGGTWPNSDVSPEVIGDGTSGWGWGTYYAEVVVPPGTTGITAYFQQNGAASGTVDYAQMGIYNLTTMGVLTP